MNSTPGAISNRLQATDGNIAILNLKSALRGSWSRFWRDPQRPGVAELIVEQELLTAQYAGDIQAYDRLEALAHALTGLDLDAGRFELITAQVACSTHRFADARTHLAHAMAQRADLDTTDRLSLTIDQATGTNLHAVLTARRTRTARPGNWGDLVPLGALLADLGQFDDADRTYLQALHEYPDVSPFPLAWVCFQLGVLWGESVPEPQSDRAAQWYLAAIHYFPGYVKARVHLSEIYLNRGAFEDARMLLTPVISCGDPEVSWRLADVLAAYSESSEAEAHRQTAQAGFESLLQKHLLAFADHAAEFYSGSGNNPQRAFELARINLCNRPTLSAFEQAYETALAAGERGVALNLIDKARLQWGNIAAFQLSILANENEEAQNIGESNHAGT